MDFARAVQVLLRGKRAPSLSSLSPRSMFAPVQTAHRHFSCSARPWAESDYSSQLDDILDFEKQRESASRTSRFKSPSAQLSNRAGSQASPRSRSSADDMKAAFAEISTERSRRGGGFDVDSMLYPDAPRPSSVQTIADDSSPRPELKLSPSTGRTVALDPSKGLDIAKCIRMLEVGCTRNNVRYDQKMQRFHERPGLTRKRLKVSRHRRRFKRGFVAMVKRVQHLRAQGW